MVAARLTRVGVIVSQSASRPLQHGTPLTAASILPQDRGLPLDYPQRALSVPARQPKPVVRAIVAGAVSILSVLGPPFPSREEAQGVRFGLDPATLPQSRLQNPRRQALCAVYLVAH